MPRLTNLLFEIIGDLRAITLTVTIFCYSLVSTAQAGSDLVVRWHGDYYQHLWETGVPGGTQREFLENRWLRGGPAQGQQNSIQGLDLDNDGQFDDSRVFFDFSLEVPLNPQGTPAKPNGVFYHTDLPSAQFYGGLSAEYFNYETDRVQQAFIENDGAGGELNDVGYPSPYLSSEFDGLSEFIENGRHPDGRARKSHVGPHEDFAINLYRPDLPHPLDELDNPADNLVTFHAAFIWKKEDFLSGGELAAVSLDADSSISFESTRWWDNVGEARFILQGDSDQLYISQFSVAGAQDNWGTINELLDPLSTNWAAYDPASDQLNFDQSAATWIDPVAANLFNDIQAVGVYIENDTPSGELTKFSLDEIRFNAVVNSNFETADFNTDGVVDGADLAAWQVAAGNVNLPGDADTDSDIDGSDFLIWQNQFNGHFGELYDSQLTTVPEASSTSLLALGLVTITFRPWKRRTLLKSGRRDQSAAISSTLSASTQYTSTALSK